MAKQSADQKATIDRVMHAFKDGDLETSTGKPVRSRRQAVAIGLSEAGASDRVSPERNRHNRARTKAVAGEAAKTKAALYAEAKKRDLPGRSTMTKDELARALA